MIAIVGPRSSISSGGIEAAKWFAVFCMVVDHINAAMYARELGPVADAIGRIAFPLFAIVLGVNLGNGADRVALLRRLILFGLLALPAHAVLFSHVAGWWPLNVMWTFAVAVVAIHLHHLGERVIAVGVFLAGAALVEYWWPGVAVVVAAYFVTRRGWPIEAVGPALLPLCLINGNWWALLAIPLFTLLSVWSPHLPRAGRFFWWFYPLHLVAICGASYAVNR